MEISQAGTFTLHLALIQPIYNEKTVTLQHVLSDERGEIWCLPDHTLCKPSFIPGIMQARRPGEALVFLRLEEGGTFWGIEITSLAEIEQRARLILEHADIIREYLTVIPHYHDFRGYVEAVGRLPDKHKVPCSREANTFDKIIETFKMRIAKMKSIKGFPAGEHISAALFEELMVDFDLWKNFSSRVKGIIRNYLTTLSADGTIIHTRSEGLTRMDTTSLIRYSRWLAEDMRILNNSKPKSENAMIVKIIAERGSILIDGEYGNIVVINGDWDDLLLPTQFNVPEYRNHYQMAKLPKEVDIRDIGYWHGDKQYQSPSDSFRGRKAEEDGQGGAHA